ncbi:DUF4148 domain-containing protein [Paraburkholderia fungorum]|uniref:DUF4148 domain-containing protein n=1 Tax=Paraburkholderia fungorum TaxID=134537 RepID=UPI0038B81163
MRNAKWLGAFALTCVGVSAAVAVNSVSRAEPVPYESYRAQASQAKTRDQVKRELAAARAMGCMDVPDSQYPQPCPLPGAGYSPAEAFGKE